MRPHLPDLVKDSQLQATIRADGTVHHFISVDITGRRIKYQEEWKPEKHLGQGSYGRVWKESCVSDNSTPPRVRAVKMILKKGFDYNRELEAIAKFSHAKYEHAFVHSMGWYESNQAIFIAMEFMPHGDLQKYMPDITTQGPFSVQETQDIISQLVEGLFFLHDNNFSHRDMKPANVLVKSKPPDNERWWVKIGDFGITKRAEDGNGPSTIKGTLGFMAPELLSSASSTGRTKESFDPQPTDMWALGEITFRMLSGKPSFKDFLSLLRWMENPTSEFLNELKPLVADEVMDFIQALLKAEPTERLSAKEALQHSWIESHVITVTEPEPGHLLNEAEQSWPQYLHDDDRFKFSEASAKWSTLSEQNTMRGAVSENKTLRPDITAKLKRNSLPTNDLSSVIKPTTPELPEVPPTSTRAPLTPSANRSDSPATTSSSRDVHPKVEDYYSTDSYSDEEFEDRRSPPLGYSRGSPANKQDRRPKYDTSSLSESERGGVNLGETDENQSSQVNDHDFKLFQDTEKGFLFRPRSPLTTSKLRSIESCPRCGSDDIERGKSWLTCNMCRHSRHVVSGSKDAGSESPLSDRVEARSESSWADQPVSEAEWSQPDTPPLAQARYDKIKATWRDSVLAAPPLRSSKETRDQPYRPLYGEVNSKSPRRAKTADLDSSSRKPTQSRQGRERRSGYEKTSKLEDRARELKIPPGYSLKNWDPDEEPVMVLGSIFDGNTLGKWIYDWAAYHHDVSSPLSDMAGELWLLLIGLVSRIKQADAAIPKLPLEPKENREMIEDFLESGERLWIQFAKILKTCEDYMWKAAKKETGGKKPVSMGKNSGLEFVNSIFGRDRELEKTEKLMTGLRLWEMRFDANCGHILTQHKIPAVTKSIEKMSSWSQDAVDYIEKSKRVPKPTRTTATRNDPVETVARDRTAIRTSERKNKRKPPRTFFGLFASGVNSR